jgi:hypothetical protein
MTTAEAIATVARRALDDHQPDPDFWLLDFQPLTLSQSIASARVMGRAGDLESNPKYVSDATNYVVDVAYCDKGYRAIYEVGPKTDPICWAD